MIRKMLVVLCGVLAFQGYVFAETWEDRAASKTPWSTDFPDDPACWNRAIEWNSENPWVVGIGSHFLYEDFADCYRACAENDTCYRTGWTEEDAAAAVTACISSWTVNSQQMFANGLGPTEHAKSPCK